MTRGRDPEKPDAADPHRDLGGVLHDVSNALTVLLGWVSEACAPTATPETTAHALRVIEQRARIARDLARRAIGGALEDEPRPAGEVALEVVEALRVEAARAGVSVTVRGADAQPRVAGVLDLAQILTNLVLNAIAYAPSGSEVVVELSSDAQSCGVVVVDRGPGVPAELRDAIFEGKSMREGGAGVGLRHSRALARARGGDVVLEQTPPPGARFRVTWPRADVVPKPRASAPRQRVLDGHRVLLIEDDEAVLQLLETALEGRGAEVTIVTTAPELPAALASGPYQTALIDLSPLAEEVGSAIARLRASCPGIDLVLITGSADRLPDAIASENMKLVRKPFELKEVLAAIHKPGAG